MSADHVTGPMAAWDLLYEKVLRPHLPYANADRALAPTDGLADLGLDSLETIALLLDLEAEYAITFPDELLTNETFSTVGALWAAIAPLVDDRSGGHGP
jgi:acyl carrier protein